MKSADATARILPWPKPKPARRAELDFLPAALEIVETPASPVGRAIGATIILFFVVALAWAGLGRVDIIATAPGKIVPTGRVKVVQPFDAGVVRAIRVQEGQTVKAGQVLVELDPTISTAERDRLAKELMVARLDAARLEALLGDGSAPEAKFAGPAGAPAAQVDLARRLLASQAAEHRAQLANLDFQLAQNEANRAAVAANVAKITDAIPLLRQRATARKTLADKEVGSRLTWLEVQQNLVEHEHELVVQRARLAEAEASLGALREQRRQTAAEFRRTNLTALTQTEQKAASLQQELVKAEQHRDMQTLTAPVDGTVQQIAVHTIGGVVTPAEQLMVVVPADSRLEIEAMVLNQDIGFVQPGAPVEIKVDTFNFTRYGLLQGKVLSLSQDAVTRDAGNGKNSTGGIAAPSGAGNSPLVYMARIALDQTQMQVDGKRVNLSPGMAVTAEIKTGSRRVIEYLLSPLLRYKHDSLTER